MSGDEPSEANDAHRGHNAHDARAADVRARNRRTGLILASIALVFFVGIIVKYTLRHG